MNNLLIAKTFQGLEPILAQELTELGAQDIQTGRRMVSFTGDKTMMYRANYCLRTALRILRPIKTFKARSADDVYEAVKAIDWSEYLHDGQTFAVDSVVYSPEFRHSKFVAYKVKDAIADQFRERTGSRPNVSVSNPDLQLHIHISDYDATLALDSSGESLHRRGYRQESVAAPINEVLAAGIILMSGWRGETDFIDPFCGSGTFCIEAALIALGLAPGVFRQGYAFERWADFDADLLESIAEDDSLEHPFEHHIYGRDNDAKAVGIARRNVKAAGLAKYIQIDEQDFCDFAHPEEPALIITNPPYGERLNPDNLMELYRTIGQKLKHEFTGGEAWVISYAEECFDKIGLKPSLKVPLFNGALECELRKYQLFDGRLDDHLAGGGHIKTDRERRQMSERSRRSGGGRFRDSHPGSDHNDHHFNKFSPHGKPGRSGKSGYRGNHDADPREARREARKRYFGNDHEED